jgi:hypothetical protein
MTTQVQNSEHRNQVRVRREEHAVWKVANQRASNVILDDWKFKGILEESSEDRIDLCLEAEAEAPRSRS